MPELNYFTGRDGKTGSIQVSGQTMELIKQANNIKPFHLLDIKLAPGKIPHSVFTIDSSQEALCFFDQASEDLDLQLAQEAELVIAAAEQQHSGQLAYDHSTTPAGVQQAMDHLAWLPPRIIAAIRLAVKGYPILERLTKQVDYLLNLHESIRQGKQVYMKLYKDDDYTAVSELTQEILVPFSCSLTIIYFLDKKTYQKYEEKSKKDVPKLFQLSEIMISEIEQSGGPAEEQAKELLSRLASACGYSKYLVPAHDKPNLTLSDILHNKTLV